MRVTASDCAGGGGGSQCREGYAVRGRAVHPQEAFRVHLFQPCTSCIREHGCVPVQFFFCLVYISLTEGQRWEMAHLPPHSVCN
jgi:hypothetical protein